MNATWVAFSLSLLFLQPAPELNIRLEDVVEGLERREAAFFNSESMILQYEWRDTDHVTLSPDEEKAMEELHWQGKVTEIRTVIFGSRLCAVPEAGMSSQ